MSTPTGQQIVSYARSLRGRPRGKVRENVNDFTQWYYGNNTAASWCLIFVCYVFNHFNSLNLLNGKVAYVPNLKNHVGSKWHTAKSGIQAGDPVTFDFNRSGEPEHVGIFISWVNASTFLSVEGNTLNDVVAVRTRRWADVFGYVKPGLATANPAVYPGIVYKLRTWTMHDSHVKWIQQRLIVHKFLPAKSDDSFYGTKTRDAVKNFQKANRLHEDGAVGPKTWAALRK